MLTRDCKMTTKEDENLKILVDNIRRKLRFEVFSRTRHELIKKEANIAQTASWSVWFETKHQHGEGKWTLHIFHWAIG